jgi:hypothetical protein
MPVEGLGAIVEETGGPVRVEPIVLEDPGPGEVLIRLSASGICHSDRWAIDNGNWGASFPMLLGHEGAGVVEAHERLEHARQEFGRYSDSSVTHSKNDFLAIAVAVQPDLPSGVGVLRGVH